MVWLLALILVARGFFLRHSETVRKHERNEVSLAVNTNVLGSSVLCVESEGARLRWVMLMTVNSVC
jgi:hypothetical protein